MTDYTKMKNAELETLLKDRGLAHTGKKADLVKRLQDDDEQKTTSSSAAPVAASKNEDEIDWDDEPVAPAPAPAPAPVAAATTTITTKAPAADPKPSTEPAAAALAAGGQGQAPNPQAVPNQIPAIDPAQTKDLSVDAPKKDTDATASEAAAAAAAPPPSTSAAEAKPPAVDFSSGIAPTTEERELEKLKARAKKFGIEQSNDEALKALERAKRFGGSGDAAAGTTGNSLTGRLNDALPERRERKRAREGEGEVGAGNKRRDQRGGAANAAGGRRGGARREGAGRPPPPPSTEKKTGAGVAGGKGAQWMSEADRARAEARKAKFAA